MRATLGLFALAWTGCFTPAPLSCTPLGEPTPPRVCDAPSRVDAESVVDLASFRAAASPLVCDHSLGCANWPPITDSFCHPAFAARIGGDGSTFDLDAARSCVAQLASISDCGTALRVAFDCFFVNASVRDSFASELDACSDGCNFGLACVDGRCTRTAAVGDACDDAHPCSAGGACVGGTCSVAQFDEDCHALPCAPGLLCESCLFGSPSAFCDVDPLFAQRHHVGCACRSDAECPTDVAVCSAGICALRPFVGTSCTPSGPPCFGSICRAGTCVLFGTGEGPCGMDVDCEPGLACFVPPPASTGTCQPRPGLGAPCANAPPCSEGCCDGTTCVMRAARGARCLACPCETGTTCNNDAVCA